MRTILRWLLVAIAICICIWPMATSNSFLFCINNPNSAGGEQKSEEEVSTFPSVLRDAAGCTGDILDKHGEAVTALFTVVLAISTILLWLETRRLSKSGEQQIVAAQTAARAAENAVAESAKMLAHAREIAERDFRPWLTVSVKLGSEIGTRYSLEKGEVTFFIEVSCVNVGKTGAKNIVYLVRGIDRSVSGNVDEWFHNIICAAVDATYSDRDSLAPSEKHVSKRWCRVPGPEEGSLWKLPREEMTCQICVGIVVAYRSVRL